MIAQNRCVEYKRGADVSWQCERCWRFELIGERRPLPDDAKLADDLHE